MIKTSCTKVDLSILKTEKIMSKITLTDLLELFQGSVPYCRPIFIATTNNYDKMINHASYGERLKALFRPGRMEPVYCQNLSNEIFDEICVHHFGRKSGLKTEDVSFEKLEISISSVINLVEKILIDDGDINNFLERFKSKYLNI